MDEMCSCRKDRNRQPSNDDTTSCPGSSHIRYCDSSQLCILATNRANIKLKGNPKCFHYAISLFLLFVSCPVAFGQNPTITSSSFNNAFGERTNITFTCTSTTPVTWSRSPSISGPSITESGAANNFVSVLSYNATANDNLRSVTCTNSNGGSAAVTPYVILVPDAPVITGPNSTNASVSNTWTCVVNGASFTPPNVYWRNNIGQAVSTGVTKSTIIGNEDNLNIVYYITSQLTLVIPPGSPTYSVTCYVVHEYGPYNVQKETIQNIGVFYPPVVTKSGGNTVSADEYNSVTLSCLVEANPKEGVSVLWLKDGATINRTFEGGNSITPNLTLRNVSRTDAGNYNCTASNSQGSGAFSTPTTLIVRYRPQFNYTNTSFTGNVNGTLTLPCPVTALPDVDSIVWRKIVNNLETIINASSERFSGGNATSKQYGLTINPLLETDKGTYYCQATNVMGTINGTNIQANVISAPVIATPNNTNVVVAENQPVTLECPVTPLDSLTDLYWTKNGQRLVTAGSAKYTGGTIQNPNLTILLLNDTDTGAYACVATNGNGVTDGPNITLNITYKPRLNVTSTPITTNPGATIILTCGVTANPAISVFHWSKSGIGQVGATTDSSKYSGGTVANPTLTISQASALDSGNYTCTAENTIGSTTSTAVVVRVVGIPFIIVSPTNITVAEGTAQINLNCTVVASPNAQSVYWTKDGRILSTSSQPAKFSGGILVQPSLTIINVNRTDAGQYKCGASNSEGNSTSVNIRVDVTYPPTVSVGQGNQQGIDGLNVTLTCGISAFPPITSLYWTKDGTTINTTANSSKYSGGTVTIPDLTIIKLNRTTDVGTYQCVAENSIGNSTSRPVNVTVTFDPYITVANRNFDVHETENFTISVSVQMYPAATAVFWFKDGARINLSNSSKYFGGNLTHPSLTVYDAQASDSGLYRIEARNGNTTSNNSTVNVVYPPKISAPSINITVDSGKTQVLVCGLNANPPVTRVEWSKQFGATITTVIIGGKFSGSNVTNPNLVITGVDASDMGVYKCTAENNLGNRTGPGISLYVNHKPKVTVSVNPLTLKVGEMFYLECSATAYPSSVSYTWYKTSVVVGSESEYSKNATYDDHTEYRCSVTNSVGTSSATVTPNVIFAPVQYEDGYETVLASRQTTVTLECTVIANPEPSVYIWKNGSDVITGASSRTYNFVATVDGDFSLYTCGASSSEGLLDPARTFDVQEKPPTSAGSTAGEELSTATIILIVIIVVILLIIIILLIIFCCLQGVWKNCCKKDSKVNPTPGPVPLPVPEPFPGPVGPKPVKSVPPAAGVIISIPVKDGAKPHYLPPLEIGSEPPTDMFYREQKQKRRSRKKKRKMENRNEEEKNLTENTGSDEGKESPTPVTGRSEGAPGTSSNV